MREEVDALLEEIRSATAASAETVESFRLKFISRKGVLPGLFGRIKEVAPEERKAMGQTLNELKQAAEARFQDLLAELKQQESAGDSGIDPTLPSPANNLGSLHPLSTTRREMVDIFRRMGFAVEYGPEIEDDWHNFSALNFAENHPAREMQDTFFVERDPDVVLRTHTSSVQIRLLEREGAPVRAIMPGRVYRNEAITARSHCFFHQIEGIYVDKNVSFANLKHTLYHFAREFFGADTKVRFRPSYFPFTEISAEMDISCFICGGEGCRVCKYSGWVEILGAGMVDPAVLSNVGIDPEVYSGFAFGMGVERSAMLKYQVNDLRLFSQNDVRFLRQFEQLP